MPKLIKQGFPILHNFTLICWPCEICGELIYDKKSHSFLQELLYTIRN